MLVSRKHWIEFALLLLVFAIGVFLYFTIPDYNLKRLDVVGLAILYPVYGIWHHAELGNLTRSITWEYSLVGVLVLVGFLAILS